MARLSPKLRSLLARVILIGGVALMASLVARSAPHEQSVVVRLNSRQASRVTGVITRQGDTEPTAGFSRDFPGASPGLVRHSFSAPNGTYIVVITLREQVVPSAIASARAARAAPTAPDTTGELSPIPNETSFERRVSLVGGEVIVSPE